MIYRVVRRGGTRRLGKERLAGAGVEGVAPPLPVLVLGAGKLLFDLNSRLSWLIRERQLLRSRESRLKIRSFVR
jgi:hypothetical protein